MTTKTAISALPEEPAVREVIPGVTTAEEVRALLNYLGDERNRFVTAEQLALIDDIPDKLDSSAVRWFGGTNLARGTSDQWMTVADGDYLAKKVKIGAWEDGVTVSVSFQINACSTPNWVIDVIDEYDYTEAVLTNSSSDDTLFYADFSLDRNEESYRFDFRVRSLSADEPVEMDIRNLKIERGVTVTDWSPSPFIDYTSEEEEMVSGEQWFDVYGLYAQQAWVRTIAGRTAVTDADQLIPLMSGIGLFHCEGGFILNTGEYVIPPCSVTSAQNKDYYSFYVSHADQTLYLYIPQASVNLRGCDYIFRFKYTKW